MFILDRTHDRPCSWRGGRLERPGISGKKMAGGVRVGLEQASVPGGEEGSVSAMRAGWGEEWCRGDAHNNSSLVLVSFSDSITHLLLIFLLLFEARQMVEFLSARLNAQHIVQVFDVFLPICHHQGRGCGH